MNIRVELQHDCSGKVFSKQLLTLCLDTLHFCNFTESETELIEMVFSNITQNLKNS